MSIRVVHRLATAFSAIMMFSFAGTAISSESNTLSETERQKGWKLLFDGKTTQGWRGFRQKTLPNGWQVRDGTLARVGSGGYIITVDQYDSFDLRFEWKVEEGGNSGVFFNVSEDAPNPGRCSPEYQILDNARHEDGRRAETSAGSNYALHAPIRDVTRPVGEWNEGRITVRGNRVQHFLNGVKLLEYDLDSPDWQKRVNGSKFKDWVEYGKFDKGFIALQDHGDPVYYRSIKIRALPTN